MTAITRALPRINKLARLVDGGAQIRVAELMIFDQVDGASQHFTQRVDEAEKLFERRHLAVGVELDKEVSVADFGIEIRAACRRTEDTVRFLSAMTA